MLSHGNLNDRVNLSFVHEILDILARAVVERLKPELRELGFEAKGWTGTASEGDHFSDNVQPRSLWSLAELEIDSGIKKGTWYKWVNQRKIPVVRLGRSLRIRDKDYRKFINQSLNSQGRLEDL